MLVVTLGVECSQDLGFGDRKSLKSRYLKIHAVHSRSSAFSYNRAKVGSTLALHCGVRLGCALTPRLRPGLS
ncbi:hypothetical protein AXFE_06470 [Acidithrix ferrooxidans]|uniref:Uncharacterized protein n=1 Tax=Acidithrix ferrooxidans TaxID=1280514 RepID=A0A0D8HN09_9ACTN|nr:hypothetical protein AXFE_06470 [Acidithrix ferrooxidans]